MRKLIVVLLCFSIVFSFVACSIEHKDESGQYHLYYLRNDILYGAEDGVISCEYRVKDQASPDTLLRQYFLGPISEHLVSPYPKGTTLNSVKQYDDNLLVNLSHEFAHLSDMDQTLACACLAKTCFSLYDVSMLTIRVVDTDLSIALSTDSLTFVDSSDSIHNVIGTEPQTP